MNALQLKDFKDAEAAAGDPEMDYHPPPEEQFHFYKGRNLELKVEGGYVISQDKPTKFKITNPKKVPQDVIVNVHSLLFEIKDARRKRGITSQTFHFLQPNGSMTFEVGFKDRTDRSLENINNVELTNLYGVMEFLQTPTYKKDDSDASWGVQGTTNKLAAVCIIGDGWYGWWKKILRAEKDPEWVDELNVLVGDIVQRKALNRKGELYKDGLMTKKIEKHRKEKAEAHAKFELEQKRKEESERRQNIERERKKKEEEERKKKNKKCVIL